MSLYPEKFFKYGAGYSVTDEKIREWLERIRKRLAEKEEKVSYITISSGNTMVLGIKSIEDDGENSIPSYDFYVCKSYEHYTQYGDEINKITFNGSSDSQTIDDQINGYHKAFGEDE